MTCCLCGFPGSDNAARELPFRFGIARQRTGGRLPEDAAMQMTSFLQTAIVFLLLTNMISALVAFYAMKASQIQAQPQRSAALERKLQALLGRN
jgi:hypothetical protein